MTHAFRLRLTEQQLDALIAAAEFLADVCPPTWTTRDDDALFVAHERLLDLREQLVAQQAEGLR